jgi:L-serine dehydratase
MESISAFDIIKIGIGPSSSHTMGPWKAAEMFIKLLEGRTNLESVKKIRVYLYGSLALTGIGHGTDIAVLMGLSGEDFTKIDSNTIPEKVELIKKQRKLFLKGKFEIPFIYETDIVFEFGKRLPPHANGMIYEAELQDGTLIAEKYFSVGGGFVSTKKRNTIKKNLITTPYACHNAATIETYCDEFKISVAELVRRNEEAWRNPAQIESHALNIWKEIKESIYRGINKSGFLPGGLNVKRRSMELSAKLLKNAAYNNLDEWVQLVKDAEKSFKNINKWVSCFALAVNEENASFGRIVTAPTNGASGVIPAVLMYGYSFENFDKKQIIDFILVAGEIGTIFKKNATISAAMGGCQAEVGVSSAMAAAGLAECLGASPGQVLMAAEIAMEHHLGLTCDPIGGLVQIPCIERNSMGAMKAITAAHIALESDPKAAKVSLDMVIKSMWDTARDMKSKYKETSKGGLAANIPVTIAEC